MSTVDRYNDTLKSRIYDQILKMILHNEVPMDELLVETRLMEKFHVSRAPIREALIELCNDNILKNIPRAGYQIVRISEKEMRDAFQLRQILELEGLRMGWKRIGEEELSELEALAQESDRARLDGIRSDTLAPKMKLNTQFHLRINRLSGNELMTRVLQDTINLLMRGLAQIMSRENEMPLPERTHHMAIVEAIRSGNLEEALRELRSDIVDQEKNMWGL
jgi:DNA-binding GntR family transcriptional regulator